MPDFTITIHVLNTATDDEVAAARGTALAYWQEAVPQSGLVAAGAPTAVFNATAEPDSEHERAWVVTGPVS